MCKLGDLVARTVCRVRNDLYCKEHTMSKLQQILRNPNRRAVWAGVLIGILIVLFGSVSLLYANLGVEDIPSQTGQLQTSLPLCPESEHNPAQWHALINTAGTCHFDHEHKHNPNDVADIFGPAGAWFGGQSISYPWQTPDENLHKHEAYSWIVRRDVPSLGRSMWIKAFRWQVHATTAPFTGMNGELHGGYLTRFHSYSLEAQVCNSAGNCGIVRTGGWIDFGHLELQGLDACVNLPHDPSQQETCGSLARRRIHIPGISPFFWYGSLGLPGTNSALDPAVLAVASADGSADVVPNDLYSLNFFCPAWDCFRNNSTISAHAVQFDIGKQYDPDKDGLANFTGYIDRYGSIVAGCTTPGLDCIPLSIVNAPVGKVQYRDDQDMGFNSAGEKDFDISPPGEWWIKYPGTSSPPPATSTPTTPQPTLTPSPTPDNSCPRGGCATPRATRPPTIMDH